MEPPWFDQPNPMELLEKRRTVERLEDEEFESLRHWAEHGYIVVRDLVPSGDIEGMLRDLDNVWTAADPIESLVIEDVKVRPEDPPGLSHKELVALDQGSRNRLKREQRWRIHGFYQFSEPARRIFTNPSFRTPRFSMYGPSTTW